MSSVEEAFILNAKSNQKLLESNPSKQKLILQKFIDCHPQKAFKIITQYYKDKIYTHQHTEADIEESRNICENIDSIHVPPKFDTHNFVMKIIQIINQNDMKSATEEDMDYVVQFIMGYLPGKVFCLNTCHPDIIAKIFSQLHLQEKIRMRELDKRYYKIA
eukprot:130537_1